MVETWVHAWTSTSMVKHWASIAETIRVERSHVTKRREPSQERGQRTQRAIIEGAARVFENKGYSDATLSDITRASGISQGSLYFHFKTKEQIALGVIQEQHDRMYAEINEGLDDASDPLVQLFRASYVICIKLEEDAVTRAGINLALGQGALREASARSYGEWTRGVGYLLNRAIRTGVLDGDLPPERLARSLVAYFTGSQLMSQATCDREDLFESVADMWKVFVKANAVGQIRRAGYFGTIGELFESRKSMGSTETA